LQLFREPIPSAAFILDVNAAADDVVAALERTAYRATQQAEDVNWRTMFYPAIEQQIRGKQLGSISHSWTNDIGIDMDWEVNLTFYLDSVTRTSRTTEQRGVTTGQGGSSAAGLGSSRSSTASSEMSAGGERQVEGGKLTGGVRIGDSTTRGSSQTAGGGLTGSQSQESQEAVNRFQGSLWVDIDVRATAGYSNWDIINPFKWGAHIAGNKTASATVRLGTIIFDRPNFSASAPTP
jgi:hypothetical protein